MGRINARSIIDEVLEMIKNNQETLKKKRSDDDISRINQSWDDTPAGQAYWKDIRARNTDMEKQKLVNQGAINVARENNSGELARAQLAKDASNQKNTNDYNADIYKSNIMKYGIDKGVGIPADKDPFNAWQASHPEATFEQTRQAYGFFKPSAIPEAAKFDDGKDVVPEKKASPPVSSKPGIEPTLWNQAAKVTAPVEFAAANVLNVPSKIYNFVRPPGVQPTTMAQNWMDASYNRMMAAYGKSPEDEEKKKKARLRL